MDESMAPEMETTEGADVAVEEVTAPEATV